MSLTQKSGKIAIYGWALPKQTRGHRAIHLKNISQQKQALTSPTGGALWGAILGSRNRRKLIFICKKAVLR
ncbi:MAG: hypothetical protein SWH68_08920 [Thermodesulfobacteriota bacterium]|nr:hypothetical protein [Thermodesulfobacteriota bacterium]